MILGLTPLVFVHTLVSLLGIATGVAVMSKMWANRRADAWTAWFLGTTILTSASGFLLPAAKLMPSHAVGILSLAILALAGYARYAKHMDAAWRTAYVLCAVAGLYFNVFVLVTQLFIKVRILHEHAPNLNEAPFAVAQGAVLVAYLALAVVLARNYHPAAIDEEGAVHA
jgi:hypothetical protein